MKTTNGKGKICIKRKKKVKVAMEVEKLKRNVRSYSRGGICGNEASR